MRRYLQIQKEDFLGNNGQLRREDRVKVSCVVVDGGEEYGMSGIK